MKKKGFTLIETMAVLIILAILAMILIPMVNDIITSSRKKAFKETVNNLLESSSIYEAGYLMNNGQELSYPVIITCNGEACADELGNAIDFKGPVPISGRIILESSELMRADLISNGMFCGSGTKGNVEVHEYCSMLDHTNPIVDDSNVDSVSVSSTTNSVIVSIPEGLMYDEESGIDRYEITIYEGSKKIETKTYEEPNVIFYNLKNNTEYKIEITGINGNRLKTTIEKYVTTLDIEKASIVYINDPISSVNGYFKSQILNVSFASEGIENPEYYIRSGRTATASNSVIANCGNGDEPTNCEEMSGIYLDSNIWYKVDGSISLTYNTTASSTSELTALVYDSVNYGGADTKTIGKIDQDKPTTSATVSGKVVTISKSDSHSGVSAYCVSTTDDSSSCTWTQDTESSAEWSVSESGAHYIYVKDGVGNISDSSEILIPSTAFCEFAKEEKVFSQEAAGLYSFTVPEGCTGVYKLEVYGAQGGNSQNSGGRGGYSYGNAYLTGGTVVYIGVGSSGGYNGGGGATCCTAQWGDTTCGSAGGGATHMGKQNATLVGTSSTNLYLVAGGGGGGGGNSGNPSGTAGNGTSELTSTYGQGQSATRYTWSDNDRGRNSDGGGGGGYRGGVSGTSRGGGGDWKGYGGAGGSGYIGGVSDGGMQAGVRSGNGAAYITFKGATYTITFDANGGTVSHASKIISPDSPIMGDMPIPTNGNKIFWGWYAESSFKTLVTSETNVIDNMHLYARWSDEDYVSLDYNGGIQGIYISKTGTYKLEAWGAQGNPSTSTDVAHALANGALGGYSYGNAYLTSGTILYVGVGSQSGFNGGGGATCCLAQWGDNTCGGSGGGATHFGKQNATLAGTSSTNLYIVAGGGGGAGGSTSDPAATAGNSTTNLSSTYGQGQSAVRYTWSDNDRGRNSDAGGGGGYYGGLSGTSRGGGGDWKGYGGTGGSGYIGGVTDGVMQSGVRSGNGTAKITFISE